MRVGRVAALGLLALVLVVAAVRVALPGWVQGYVNDVLDRTEGYAGQVEDVDLALLRGAYRIEGVTIEKEEGGVRSPLFTAPEIDLSVEWVSLLQGELVGEVHIRQPVFHFAAAPTSDEAPTQTGEEGDWGERLEALLPVRINRFEIEGGTAHLLVPDNQPPVDVTLRDLQLVARNWSNVRDREAQRPARAELSGRILDGSLRADLAADPLAARPDFSLDVKLEDADLTRLNDFLRAYAGLDVQKGRFALYSEVQAEGGGFEGYVKPLVRDLDVLRLGKEADDQGVLATAWEAVAGFFSEGIENQPEDQLGTRIPLSGRFENAEVGVFAAVVNLLRNGFVDALEPSLEGVAGAAARKG